LLVGGIIILTVLNITLWKKSLYLFSRQILLVAYNTALIGSAIIVGDAIARGLERIIH